MAHVHEGHGTTVVSDERSGMATAFIALLAVALVGFLIWLFAFSGVVIDRGNDGGTPTKIEQNNTDTNTGGGGQQPTPAAS
jgi:hypothetical protein